MIAALLFVNLTTQAPVMTEYMKHKTMVAISRVESNSGKNTKHVEMKYGIHKGASAIGNYGLMPLTIKEIIKKDKLLSLTHGYVLKMNQKDLNRLIKNDVLFEYELASKYFDRLYTRYGSVDKVIYSWLNGSVKGKNYRKHWYVKRVLKCLD